MISSSVLTLIGRLLAGAVGVAGIAALWLLVQRASAQSRGLPPNADPLEGRTKCHDCTCEGACEADTPDDRAHPNL
ncbi:MAG: hypothetical protein Fur0037_20140 [Planctomycetota bacterium]